MSLKSSLDLLLIFNPPLPSMYSGLDNPHQMFTSVFSPQLPKAGTRLPSPDICYISRHWLYLLKHFSCPGPILQYEYACKHGAVVPEKAGGARDLAMCIRREVWEDLEKKHGGGPFVPHLEACTICQVSSTLGFVNLMTNTLLLLIASRAYKD